MKDLVFDKSVKKISKSKCKHINTKSLWKYNGNTLIDASGYCEDCGAKFGLPLNNKKELRLIK